MIEIHSRLSNAYSNNPTELSQMVSRFTRLILAVEIPICFALVGTADLIVPILFGEPFTQASSILMILAFVLPFHTLNGLLGYLLQAAGLEKKAMMLVLIGLAANILLTFGLTSFWGTIGAAWGTFLTTLIIAVLHMVMVLFLLKGIRPLKGVWKVIPPAVLGGFFFIIPIHIYSIQFLPVLVSIILLPIMGAIQAKDVHQVLALIRLKKKVI